jgi:beta-mannanase
MAASSCGSAGHARRSRDTAPASDTTRGRHGGPPPIPSSGAYVGAWVNPGGESGLQGELRQLPGFEQATGRVPAVVSVYTAFAAPPARASLNAIADQGAVPLISWECQSVGDVASGADDGTVSAYARALREFGRPVFLRWFWEMNLMHNDRCLDTGNPSAADQDKAAGYAAAFQRIYKIFKSAGATNVALVWCPSTGSVSKPMDWFYPGDDNVDWIAADGYDRLHKGTAAFTHQFQQWYGLYENRGRPLMVSETGAPADDQVSFLQGLSNDVPTKFPDIKAVVYFDGEGTLNWRLDQASGGVQAFNDLGNIPYFQSMPARN